MNITNIIFISCTQFSFKRKLYIRIRWFCMNRLPVLSVVREITPRNVHKRLILESNWESANGLFY